MTCSDVFSSVWTNYFSLCGTVETFAFPPVLKRIYTSYDNRMGISSRVTSGDRVNCNWEMMTVPSGTTDFKFCIHGRTKTSSGTIRPLDMSTGETRWCRFFIEAPSNQRVQMTCSSINLGNSPTSYMRMRGQDIIAQPPIVNQIYTTNEHYLDFDSRITNPDWFECKWTFV
ncbi:uncharacterized protein LOC124326581 [Daphnia pulicaria]|uniref:uncharacterized protein LOC124326581 n=1 Tax=Daphnia pulicaria TaxID=35523 RepID=UPI001EEBDD8D|nr:uncharacterized protein LOC124326581 [Daphnia pulicaria]XP_046641445.1 uncharacterized protein LOC124326581 [Daphnia pulicaria]